MSIPTTLAASFAGVSFGITQTEGVAKPGMPSQKNYVMTDVNFGSDTYIQDLGFKAVEQSYDCIVPLANWPALQAKQGQTGTLTTAPGISRTAYMGNIPVSYSHDANGYVHVTLTWVIR